MLTVCSGNICRSPLAQGLLIHGLSAHPGVLVGSAGVVARDGDVVTPQTAALGNSLGVDLSSHRARYLDEMVVAEANLVLAMTRAHRRSIVELVPRKVSSTFTLREFARLSLLVADEEIARLAQAVPYASSKFPAAVALVAARRGQSDPPLDPRDDDVVDPYRSDQRVYDQMAEQLTPAVAQVVRFFQKVRDLC
ncbi:low molecular weight phosphatase family protein [Subtercola boreus]